MLSRRHFGTLAIGGTLSVSRLWAQPSRSHSIGACDWSLGQRQHIDAFRVAQAIGLEGLQVSFSTPGSDYDLRDPLTRERYYRRSEETGIQLASLGMGVLNQQPLATHPESIQWVSDAIDVMATMEREHPKRAPRVCLLAFFGKADLNGKPELQDTVIRKLKPLAPKAEAHGLVLGIESLLSAKDHLRMIESVGSPALQVYYDSANSHRMGYDINQEVVEIGGDRICEVHCKERGEIMGKGAVDFRGFRDALNKADYRGWLIIEGSKPKAADLVSAYRRNLQHLDTLFRSRP